MGCQLLQLVVGYLFEVVITVLGGGGGHKQVAITLICFCGDWVCMCSHHSIEIQEQEPLVVKIS